MQDNVVPDAELAAPLTSVHPPETKCPLCRDYDPTAIDGPAPLTVDFRHSGWQPLRRKIYDAMQRTNQSFARCEQFEYCGHFAYVLESLDHPGVYRIAGSACHDRFCLPCARERSHDIALNVLEATEGKRLRFLTLTVKSDNESLAPLLDKLYRGFQVLRRRAFWRNLVHGGIAFLEVNWHSTRQRWHPHFHLLLEGSYIPHRLLRRLWNEITGDSFIVDIRPVRDNTTAARYVSKYASKPFNKTFVHLPDRLDEALVTLKGRKLVFTFGTWRGLTVRRQPDETAWIHVGTLNTFIVRAACGDTYSRNVLESLTDRKLDALYARAPPLPPTGPNRSCPQPQLTWFGVWQANANYSHPEHLRTQKGSDHA